MNQDDPKTVATAACVACVPTEPGQWWRQDDDGKPRMCTVFDIFPDGLYWSWGEFQTLSSIRVLADGRWLEPVAPLGTMAKLTELERIMADVVSVLDVGPPGWIVARWMDRDPHESSWDPREAILSTIARLREGATKAGDRIERQRTSIVELQHVLNERTRERDFWAEEGARLTAQRDEAMQNLHQIRGTREQVLEQAIADLVVMWSTGVQAHSSTRRGSA